MSRHSLTEQQKWQFHQMFNMFDKDGIGSITTTELRSVLRALGINPSKAEIAQMIHEADPDGTGTIESSNFLTLMSRKAWNDTVQEELQAAFRTIDNNGDGFLTVNELSAVMRNYGEWLTHGEWVDLLEEADLDGDGRINYEEFSIMLTK